MLTKLTVLFLILDKITFHQDTLNKMKSAPTHGEKRPSTRLKAVTCRTLTALPAHKSHTMTRPS